VGAAAAVTDVRAVTPRTSAHIASGGWIVIFGDPDIACPELATTPATFDVELVTRGALVPLSVTVPAGSSLPFSASDVEVPRPTIAVAGTVLRRAFPRTAIGGATVTLSGAHPAGSILGLQTVLSAAHAVASVVEVRAVTMGAAFTVTRVASGGADELALNSVTGLVAGSLLALPQGEFAIVDAVDSVATTVTLRLPLCRTLQAATVVHSAALGGPLGSSSLTRSALGGDGLVVTASALTGATARVVDGDPNRTEVRGIGTVTDGDGRYRIAGIRGVDAISMTFAATGFVTLGPDSHPIDPSVDPTVVDAALAV
jgi:hypothetical protein